MRLGRTITMQNRADLIRAVQAAPLYSRLTLQGPRRSSAQNALMWVLLSAFADQLTHNGRKYDEETWKCIGMHALGKHMEFVLGFEGEVVGLGYRSSGLDTAEMSDLIELLYSEGAKRGVRFEKAA